MPSLRNQNPEHRGIDWPAIARIVLVQVLVLLALSGAFVGYVNWSSDVAYSEFLAVSKAPPPAAKFHPRSAMRVNGVTGKALCVLSI